MTSINDLQLTTKQTEALRARNVERIEGITGEILSVIDGRMRTGIAVKLERWRAAQGKPEPAEDSPDTTSPVEPDDAPTDTPPEPLWHGMSFGDRVANLREQRSYIRKLMKHGMDYSAVLFDDLLNQVRDLFLAWGISWHTTDTTIIESRTHDRGELLIFEDLIVFTFRFQNVEGPTGSHLWFCDIKVPARSLDIYDPEAAYPQGDKGPGKAHTYGQKLALRTFLNLPAGDDPDFTPAASLGNRTRALREEHVARLRRALLAAGLQSDQAVNEQIQLLITGLNERYTRGLEQIEDVPDQILLGWCEHFEGKSNDGSGRTPPAAE